MQVAGYYIQLNADLRNGAFGTDYVSVVEAIAEELTFYWIENYRTQTPDAEIVRFKDDTFSFLFDLTEDNNTPFVLRKTKEARIVAAFGMTKNNTAQRNKSRMQGFIGGFRGIQGYTGYDKGHFISHKIGGMLDQNLFPQKSEVNQGRSEDGKRYRNIERFCERNEGIFMFSHPVYQDASWIPAEIEIGFLSKDLHLTIERVGN
jgi:hypothetical protein